MEFRSTEGSIDSLKNKSSISVDDMLGLVVCTVSDCYKNVGVKEVSDMEVKDQKRMVLNLGAIAAMLVNAAEINTTAFKELQSSAGQQIKDNIKKLKIAGSDYEKASGVVGELIKQEKSLREKLAEVEAQHQEYDRIKAECKSLQTKIDKLSDADLDAIKSTRDSLSEELTNRQALADSLNDEITKFEVENDKWEADIKAKETEKTELENSIKSAEKEKTELEGTLTDLNSKLEEIKKWNDNFPVLHKNMQEESDRAEAMLTQISNSMNGIFADKFLLENLFSNNGAEKLTPESHPDLEVVSGKIDSAEDLKEWADGMAERIESLLGIYREELRCLVECGDKVFESRSETEDK